MKRKILLTLLLLIIPLTLVCADEERMEVTCTYQAEYNNRFLFIPTGKTISTLIMVVDCPRNVKAGDICILKSVETINSDGRSTGYNASFQDTYPQAGDESGCMPSLRGSTDWYDHFFGTEHPSVSLVECSRNDDICYKIIDYKKPVYIDPSNKYNNIQSCKDATYKYIKQCGCMPAALTDLTSRLYMLIKIAAPALLLIVGGFDLVKAMSAQDEKAIKKSQQKLVKKFVAAAAVFLILTLVQFLVSTLSNNTKNTLECLDYLLNGYVA